MQIIIDFLVNKILDFIWNNLYFLRFMFFILLILSFFIYKKRKSLKNVFLSPSYLDICLDIGDLLNKNENLFREFSPNSSLDSQKDPLQQDLNLWNRIKKDEIGINNKKIKELILNNENKIPTQEKNVFSKMVNHVIAFNAHIEDDTIDYRNNQFPTDFQKLIYSKSEFANNKKISKIKNWLKKNLSNTKNKKYSIEEIWLYGSILKSKYENINDIDVLVFSQADKILMGNELADYLKNIQIKFKNKFKKDLHISIFLKQENEGFIRFLNDIDIKRKL